MSYNLIIYYDLLVFYISYRHHGDNDLRAYVNIQSLGAIFIEISFSLGCTPPFKRTQWKTETIIDLPWAQLIITPKECKINEPPPST